MALKSGRVGIHPSQVDPITGMLLSGPSGTSDYEQLSNLPKINSVTLKGNKSLSDLGVPTSFEDMSDSDISAPEEGQILQYNGSGWENVYASISPVTPATLASLSDVDIDDPTTGQTLEYDGSKWKNVNASIAPTTLAALQDVDITSPADGDYLVYDGTNHEWVNSGSAPAPTYPDVTATFYGAVEDIISFTDAAGISHLVTFETNASSKQETFKIDPSGSSITFTSSVAKNPNNLSESYSKTVTITSATTEIWVMPANALYWYGYQDADMQILNTTNGWSGSTFSNPTFNKNSVRITTPAGNTGCGIGSGTTHSMSSSHAIVQGITANNNSCGNMVVTTSKNIADESAYIGTLSAIPLNTLSHISDTYTQTSCYLAINNSNVRSADIFALWYE